MFYIGVGADGDGALYKYETNGGVFGDGYSVNEELVPDVENMQILYGVETGASQTTQTVAQYVTANNVATTSITGDFNGVISVQIALLVASPPSTVPVGSTVAAPTLPPLPRYQLANFGGGTAGCASGFTSRRCSCATWSP